MLGFTAMFSCFYYYSNGKIISTGIIPFHSECTTTFIGIRSTFVNFLIIVIQKYRQYLTVRSSCILLIIVLEVAYIFLFKEQNCLPTEVCVQDTKRLL